MCNDDTIYHWMKLCIVVLHYICAALYIVYTNYIHLTEFNDHTISNYSLYVLGGNGDVIEYMVEPRKASTANEGSDAPVELIQSPKLCWRLLR